MFKRNFWVKPAAFLPLALLLTGLMLSGCGNPAGSTLISLPPARPVITSVISGNKSLTVTWNAAAYAEGYDLYFAETAAPPTFATPGSTGNVTINGTTGVIKNLTNGTVYYIWVRAKNILGVSEYSAAATGASFVMPSLRDGRYKSAALPVDAGGYGADLYIIEKGTISYDDGYDGSMSFAGQLMGYKDMVFIVQITAAGEYGPETGKFYGIYGGGVTPFSFTGGNAYKADSSHNTGMDTLAGAQGEYTDANTYFSIKAAYGLYTGEATVTGFNASLQASWTAVPGATGYDIYFSNTTTQPMPDTAAVTANVSITGTTATITGLTNGTLYRVWVRAKNGSTTGAWVYQGYGTPQASS
jgi:hypothetical protein